jgi:hypothetical protein
MLLSHWIAALSSVDIHIEDGKCKVYRNAS